MDVNKERKKPQETLDVYKLYQKMSKSHPGKEKEIFAHLKEMYAVRTRLSTRTRSPRPRSSGGLSSNYL